MIRIAVLLMSGFLIGCSSKSDSGEFDSSGAGEVSPTEVADGGFDKADRDNADRDNADRDNAERYLVALGNVTSGEEEHELLKEFGEWLAAGGYKIKVEEKDGVHNLSCPFFPPVTPWTDHSFYDLTNLTLLPQLEDGDMR